MCGIFGLVLARESTVAVKTLEAAARDLFGLSEARGKESAGLALGNGGPVQVFKQPIPASVMVRSRSYKQLVRDVFSNGHATARPGALIGHSRLVTNGFQENNENNQPVIADGMVAVHNGIITNDEALWRRFPEMHRAFEVDTEVLLRMIRMYQRQGRSPTQAVRSTFEDIEGYASIAVLFDDLDYLLLATNNGSLYTLAATRSKAMVFASERFILESLAARHNLRELFAGEPVRHIEPGMGCWIRLNDLHTEPFSLFGEATADRPEADFAERETHRQIIDLSSNHDAEFAHQRVKAYSPIIHTADDNEQLLYAHLEALRDIKRCTRCVLPETYPFIQFDATGVCNYCRDWIERKPKGVDALAEKIERFRRPGKPDCMVAVSGGRDSVYGLHYMNQVLGMNTVAYTYDWGMVTDLARRNISRICGKLGVEHLLVSADINRKRANIRKNILAWLKRPSLGMIPLFMAGDKQFYYYARQLQKQTGIDLVIWCSGSYLECADFKWHFCGIDISSGSLAFKMQLLRYYAKEYLLNPSYLNSSVLDTIFAYYSYYFLPRDFLYLYEYLPWNEDELLAVLVDEYGWELSSDTKQTWRIGDGTASFYNFIYHTAAGFTENETFRSEQVRRGMITREKAIQLVESENRPRYESIKSYLSIIGVGDQFNRIIERINQIPKTYSIE